ncbi:MAG: hypothetical protein ACR2P4_03390 [Gammaproteobacteria bacterium]
MVEIAIVLVVIGLLLGGILKGQELINNAKVRAIADRHRSLKVAWFAFIDRYQALPGDYVFAAQYIPGAMNGDGDGITVLPEVPRVFQHLTGAGYLRCPQCTESAISPPTAYNSLLNTYGGIMAIFNNGYFANPPPPGAIPTFAYAGRFSNLEKPLMVHSGRRIPSNIAAEVDLKIDDGIANMGEVRFNSLAFDVDGSQLSSQNGGVSYGCVTKSRDKQINGIRHSEAGVPLFYRHASEPPIADCGISSFI